MFAAGDVVVGFVVCGLMLLNIYQFGKVREQRAINAENCRKLAVIDIKNKENEENLARLKQPITITMTEQQVMGMANMLQQAFIALNPSLTNKKPN